MCYASAIGTSLAVKAVMIGNANALETEPSVLRPAPFRSLAKRVLAMMALWMFFGVIVGSTLLKGNLVGVVSGAIAGAIVLPWLGMFLGLLGGSVKDSFLGGVTGVLVYLLCSAFRPGPIDSYTLNVCLIMSGIMGANFAGFLAVRKRLRARRFA
jgi:hypothetical protein